MPIGHVIFAGVIFCGKAIFLGNMLRFAFQGLYIGLMRYLQLFGGFVALLFAFALFVGAPVVVPVKAQQIPVLVDNALIEAARRGDIANAENAIAAGFAINRQGVNGRNALQVAAEWGRLDMVEFLWGKGARLGLRSRDRHTPLSLAVQNNHPQVVAYLLKIGADPDAYGSINEVPLIAATRAGRVRIVKLLLAAGARSAETDMTGRTAADWARQLRHRDILVLFEDAN